ncbi:MAG: TonB-dependent receptor, partial [Longimicrobiales bacterium]
MTIISIKARTVRCVGLWCAMILAPLSVVAQDPGAVEGRVVHTDDGSPVPEVVVSVQGLWMSSPTDQQGRFALPEVPAGARTLVLSWAGYLPQTYDVEVAAGQTVTLEMTVAPTPIPLGELRVVGASRQPERVVDAPAAVNIVNPVNVRDGALTSQIPQSLKSLTGVDVAQSGVQDFNISTRGFNSMVNRRVLVLQDGRDLATPALANQEWSALSVPLDDFERIEMVRGPGSALYGANAFSGVLNLISPTARQTRGTKVALGGGELGTRRADGRFAAVTSDLRLGFRVNAGYYSSESWDRSRTELDYLDSEYGSTIDTGEHPPQTPFPGFELKPLRGQTKEGMVGTPGASTGTADAIENAYGSARLDYYFEDG